MKIHTFALQGKTVSVLPSPEPDAPVIYLNTFAEEEPQVLAALRRSKLPAFSLVTIRDLDWNRDMVPWDAPSPFHKAPACIGGADAYLQLLTGSILPTADQLLSAPPRWRGLAGYSLAGLFALYALYRTDMFSRAASMSGSLWFPGLREYALSHQFKRTPDCLYFSLGDKESKTRNPVLQTVRENTEALCTQYRAQGIHTDFVLHPGNHYSHAPERTALGLAWLLGQ